MIYLSSCHPRSDLDLFWRIYPKHVFPKQRRPLPDIRESIFEQFFKINQPVGLSVLWRHRFSIVNPDLPSLVVESTRKTFESILSKSSTFTSYSRVTRFPGRTSLSIFCPPQAVSTIDLTTTFFT